jgi:hypothetical protein
MIAGHRTKSVFGRYYIVSDHAQMVTKMVTVGENVVFSGNADSL